jgi:hypothetical protein
MLRSVLIDAWPLALGLALAVGALASLARIGSRLVGRRPLAELHGDETGGVQSVSFVLTVPVFIMLMLLVVQVTQLMIGLVVVHYAAFAAVRSASVWIPARMPDTVTQGENRIGVRELAGRRSGGTVYQIRPGFPKYEKVRQAAALACISIAPSRNVGVQRPQGNSTTALQAVFAAAAPQEVNTNAIAPQRLANKWAYANAATDIEITTFHRDDEPPLIHYYPWLPDSEFNDYEIGWRDKITVTVTHHFALLPGPARLLARQASPSDRISPQIQRVGNVYTIPLRASATLVPEGEKSVAPYLHADL